MDVEFVRSVSFQVVRCGIGSIWSELRYIIYHRRNVDNHNVQLQTLEAAKQTLQQRVDAAEQNGETIFVNVQNCLMKASVTIIEATDFQENEGNARVGCLNGPFPNLWTMHQQSKKATEMVKEIYEITKEVNEVIKMDKISSLPRLSVSFPPFARGYEALHSRTSILIEIMQELKHDNVHMIGVYGMGGVGKSTLIKEVAWQAEHDGSFGVVIVVNVSSSPDMKKIQAQIADRLVLQFNEESKEGRAQRLWDRIKKENKILVIMDDIWKKIDLTEVGVPYGDEHKGCKLLLTSRNLNMLNNEMGTQKNYRLETLSEEESWNLLEKTAGDVAKDDHIQPTAFEVARACMGLPLLIVTVAKALKKKDLYAWKDAFRQLTKYDHEGLPSVANEAIELSYKYLENDQHRSLFLLIASDGKKYVYIGDLLLYGWGLGLFKNIERLADASNRLYKLIDDLKASSLLLEGKKEWVSMHDVIREAATKIASRVQPVFRMQVYDELKQWPKVEQLRNYKHIFLPWCYMPLLPESLDCPELEILVLCNEGDYLKVPNHFFSRMRDLKVLDLGGMMCTPSLPSSLCLLNNLRALFLYQCILEDITIVSKLTDLEILCLDRSEIEELPEEIGQLTQLCLLSLGNCKKLRKIPANLISSLTVLEELYIGNCCIQWEIKGSEQCNYASLDELRHLYHLKSLHLQIQDISHMPRDLLIFGKLENFNILIGDGWTWPWDYVGYSETSRTLKMNMSLTTTTHLDSGVKLLLNGVEDLSLSEVKGARNVFPGLSGEAFAHLRHLLIQDSVEILYIIDSKEWVHPRHPFLNLESLVIRNLINLEKICCGQLPVHIFTKLQVIKVEGCESLGNLFSFSMARNLPQLREIEISECKFMTNVIVDQLQEEFEDNTQISFPKIHSIKLGSLPNLVSFSSKQRITDIQLGSIITENKDNSSNALALFDEKGCFNEQVVMPNLETMELTSINTTKLWDDMSTPSSIQNLTLLIVDSCDGLKYLFSSSMAVALVNLQYLKITNCQMMEDIFFPDRKLPNLQSAMKPLTCEEVKFRSLETLVVSHMDNLKSIYHDELAPNPFPNLIKTKVSFCQKLLRVFPSHVINSLHNLEKLDVSDCVALEVVFGTLNFGTLTLEGVPMLKDIWSNNSGGGDFAFMKLKRLTLENLPRLTCFCKEKFNFKFPLLKTLSVTECPEMETFYHDIMSASSTSASTCRR